MAISPTYKECKICPFVDICHNGMPVERNCRSCARSRPIDGAAWHCDTHNAVIPAEFITQGCGAYQPIA